MGDSGSQCTLLNFFVARLVPDGAKLKAQLALRFKVEPSSEDVTRDEAALAAFCFPLGPDMVPAKEQMAQEEYTFTLTYGDGRRFQGFCRRCLPPPPKKGSRLRHPRVLCLIAQYPWYDLFFKVLHVLECFLHSTDQTLDSDLAEIPELSPVGAFLRRLGRQLTPEPSPGQVIHIQVPNADLIFGSDPPKFLRRPADDLTGGGEYVELQVPPYCGNGKWNSGLSLARLLWNVPVSAVLSLVAAMLLERRIIVTAQSRDAVSAAVQAAAALLYPFKWHHIYLPLLPKSFMDYLTAPMPFMVGLPAPMLPMLKHIPMDEVTLIDVDLGKCDPAPGSDMDDARHLPWRESLERALTAAYTLMKSPTEHESSPMIAAIMQEYFCTLFANIGRYIHVDTTPAQRTLVVSQRAKSTSNLRILGSRGGKQDPDQYRDVMRGYGQVFEHSTFVDSFRQHDKAWRFLTKFRHSQMYEVFVQERLRAVAEGSKAYDAFDERVKRYHERQRSHRSHSAASVTTRGVEGGSNSSTLPSPYPTDSSQPLSRLGGLLRGHRRGSSADIHDGQSRGMVAASSVGRRTTADTALHSGAADGLPNLDMDPAMFFESVQADVTMLDDSNLPGASGRYAASMIDMRFSDSSTATTKGRLPPVQHLQQMSSPYSDPGSFSPLSARERQGTGGDVSFTALVKDMWSSAKEVFSRPGSAGHSHLEMQEMQDMKGNSTAEAMSTLNVNQQSAGPGRGSGPYLSPHSDPIPSSNQQGSHQHLQQHHHHQQHQQAGDPIVQSTTGLLESFGDRPIAQSPPPYPGLPAAQDRAPSSTQEAQLPPQHLKTPEAAPFWDPLNANQAEPSGVDNFHKHYSY